MGASPHGAMNVVPCKDAVDDVDQLAIPQNMITVTRGLCVCVRACVLACMLVCVCVRVCVCVYLM